MKTSDLFKTAWILAILTMVIGIEAFGTGFNATQESVERLDSKGRATTWIPHDLDAEGEETVLSELYWLAAGRALNRCLAIYDGVACGGPVLPETLDDACRNNTSRGGLDQWICKVSLDCCVQQE